MHAPHTKPFLLLLSLLAAASQAAAQSGATTRVSVSSQGTQAQGDSRGVCVTPNARYVAFSSYAGDLVINDTNNTSDIFVHDRTTLATTRVNLGAGGTQGNADSWAPALSDDGNLVIFESIATNLVLGDTNNFMDVFLRNRQTGTTTRVSLSSAGVQADGDSSWPTISGDGSCIAFSSAAKNLVPNDTNVSDDVFVKNRLTGAVERVSVDSNGVEANGASYQPTLSSDGRYVAFWSFADNLVPNDTNGSWDVFVHDRATGTTERISESTTGAQADLDCIYSWISADGRFVAFDSLSTTLAPGDTNFFNDVFVKDRQTGTLVRVSLDSLGNQSTGDCYARGISADGLHVTFEGVDCGLVATDTNGYLDCFVHDLATGETDLVSRATSGLLGDGDSDWPVLSGDGNVVVFNSTATNLVTGDTNQYSDIFVHVRHLLQFTSLCQPGSGGVIACPCANPAVGTDRGCNNSSGTGGGQISASGASELGFDTLVFTTSGEKPSATSVLMQGNALVASGVVFGQGVRCAGGLLKRLYVKTASNGSISAPTLGAGDPSVSARSAALGDPITAGQSRWYFVYYRDPVVLGSCAAATTFNATQTGRIDWLQ